MAGFLSGEDGWDVGDVSKILSKFDKNIVDIGFIAQKKGPYVVSKIIYKEEIVFETSKTKYERHP